VVKADRVNADQRRRKTGLGPEEEKEKENESQRWAVDFDWPKLKPKPIFQIAMATHAPRPKAQALQFNQIGPPMSIQAQSDLGFPNIQRA
jgi:hypothetical protein